MVRVIAHRGGAAEGPENTLEAFRHAVALGCHGLEMDLRATSDGAVVVLHDPDVDRVTDGTGPVEALTLEAVRALDAAHAFVDGRGTDPDAGPHRRRGGGVRVPTFAEVLDATPGVALVVDLKVGPPEVPGFPAAVADLLAAAGRTSEVIVGSFDQERLDAYRQAAPGAPTSATQAEVAAFWSGGPPPQAEGFCAFQVPARFADLEVVTTSFVERAHEAGVEVHVWTVDDPAEMRRLAELGVDAIITDRPALALEVLRG
jgi:glycerophosphoryl diester phosphodiesterase